MFHKTFLLKPLSIILDGSLLSGAIDANDFMALTYHNLIHQKLDDCELKENADGLPE